MGTSRARRVGLVGCVVAAAGVVAARAGEGGAPKAPPAADVSPTARDACIAKACAYLDKALWNEADNLGGSPQKPYAAATAGWAYLLLGGKSASPIPPRAKEIDRVEAYLEKYEAAVASAYLDDKNKKAPASPLAGAAAAAGFNFTEATQFTWPFSAAAHFHAESLARNVRGKESRAALQLIVRALERGQQPDGGWGHDDASHAGMGLPPLPIPGSPDKLVYPHTLLASSHCALGALGAAHRALGTKDAPSLRRGREHFVAAQNGDGAFPYDRTQTEKSSPPRPDDLLAIEVARTSGAVYAMLEAGAAAGDAPVAKALAMVDAHVAWGSEGHGSATLGLEYAALLARVRGGDAWAKFRAEFFPRILASQTADGSFDCACRHVSFATTCDTHPDPALAGAAGDSFASGARTYVAAIHVLVLALDRDESKSLPKFSPAAPTTPK